MDKPRKKTYYDYQEVKTWLQVEHGIDAGPVLQYLLDDYGGGQDSFSSVGEEMLTVLSGTSPEVQHIIRILLDELDPDGFEMKLWW